MSILKPVAKVVEAAKLIPDYHTNVRDEGNYDLPLMKEQIATAGRVIKPLIVEEITESMLKDHPSFIVGHYLILQGNRRCRAVQEMIADPATPQELAENLRKLHVMVYKGLSDTDRMKIIADHGEEKSISRSELVKMVWRMAIIMSERDMILSLYQDLADYTGNRKKLNQLPKSGPERDKAIQKWFHGTLGNVILRGSQLGEYVKEQFLLSRKAEDGFSLGMNDDGTPKKLEMKVGNQRLQELSQAKSTDEKAKGWTYEKGGETFNALIEKFKAEDASDTPKERATRFTVKELKDKANALKSTGVKKALLLAAGEQGEAVNGIINVDEEAARWEVVARLLVQYGNDIKDENVRRLVGTVLHANPVVIEKALQELVA